MENYNFQIKEVGLSEIKDVILHKHYAQRKPSISKAFGLYKGEELIGVCTFGKPASASLCKGVCGEEHSHRVYELNRLWTKDDLPRNTLSWFLSRVLKKLKPLDWIIVSYSDEGMKHHGYIYQATNWIYTGKTKQRTDKYSPNGKHSRHYSDEYMHFRKVRTSKHRYVYFVDNKKNNIKLLNYPVIPTYPKGDNGYYQEGYKIQAKVINTITGEVFYE